MQYCLHYCVIYTATLYWPELVLLGGWSWFCWVDGAGFVGYMELAWLGGWSWFCWVDGAGSVGWMELVLLG